jgi:hypothetical protein
MKGSAWRLWNLDRSQLSAEKFALAGSVLIRCRSFGRLAEPTTEHCEWVPQALPRTGYAGILYGLDNLAR